MTMYRKRERGFILVETMVAFMVLAIGIASVGASVGLAMRSDARLEARRVALRAARSQLEAAGIAAPLAPGRLTGRGNRAWSETVTALPTGAAEPAALAASSAPAVRGYWVEVTVETGDGGTVRLSALKLAPTAAR